ncbi:MAG: hypothetical protein QOI24_2398 [Acidobacteriota bacterium]|jgi:hypothetical protein|nr:hypothetical protein [Acidobacteriota bacterium]
MSVIRRSLVVLLAALLTAATPTPPYLAIRSTPAPDLPRSASQEDLAKFAWQEFLALNWKASIDSTHPPSPTNPRGTPDAQWTHANPAPQFPDPLVWQTYAQTTELRPNSPLTIAWANLSYPKYSYAQPPVSGIGSFNLWNNLDEDNEIGSCDINGQYTNQPSPRELVLFQVKVNRDEYEYVRTNYGADQNLPGGKLGTAGAQAKKNIQSLPNHAYYPGATNTCNCPPEQAICLPCGLQAATPIEGAIEVKSAWRRLLPSENAGRFYTTTAIYYDTDANGNMVYRNGTFALVAMHIIHKTTNFPDFVFATFEQVDVEQSDANFLLLEGSGKQVGQPPIPIKRQTDQTNRQQMHPVSPTLDRVTANVRAQLKTMNPSSVWQYYRLTGVQGRSVDCSPQLHGHPATTNNCISYQNSTQCTSLDENYYMANFMVESDPFLNNFSGPGFGNGGNAIFGNGCQNTVYANNLYDNGGCKGCHGAAQTGFGTDFSFLLDFGNNKPSIVPATIHYVDPTVKKAPAPLKQFMRMMKQSSD